MVMIRFVFIACVLTFIVRIRAVTKLVPSGKKFGAWRRSLDSATARSRASVSERGASVAWNCSESATLRRVCDKQPGLNRRQRVDRLQSPARAKSMRRSEFSLSAAQIEETRTAEAQPRRPDQVRAKPS